MKYQVTVKVANKPLFNTEVEAKNEWHSTSCAMAEFLKTTKLSGELVMYRVKDLNGNLVINQF